MANLFQRNTASSFLVYAYTESTGAPLTGDAANIDCKFRLDGGTSGDLADPAPDELDATNEKGYYRFNVTADETNGNDFGEYIARSSTSGVTVITCGGPRFTFYEPALLDNGIIAKAAALATIDTEVGNVQTDVTAILADTADIQPKIGTPAADLSADIAAVKSDSAAILTDTADIQPKIGTITDLGGGATVGANLSNLAGATFNAATDSQEAIRDAITTVDTVVDGIQTDLDNATDGLGAIKTAVDSLNDPTAATIADAVWDEAKSGHVAAGSFGEEVQLHALSSEISALNDPSAATIADAVWDEARAGHVAAGSFGENVALPAATETQIDAIETRVVTALPNALPGAPGGLPLFDDLKILSDYGTVNDGSASTTSCVLSDGFDNTEDDFYKNAVIVFDLEIGKGRARVTAYTAVTRAITYAPALPVAPANGAYVEILGLSL